MNLLKEILYFFCGTCRPHRSRTVRYAFPIVLTAVALLSALSISSTNQSTIVLESSKTTVKAGDLFSINVYVSAHVPINAVDLSIKVPDSQINVEGIDTGESVITLWTEEPSVTGDIVLLRGGTFRKGFLGKHLIATINARAVDSGLAYIDVSKSLLLAGDGTGSTVETKITEEQRAKLYIANKDGTFDGLKELPSSAFEGSAEIRIITDIDGDGEVSLNDISRFMSAWRSGSVVYDFSGDGRMTFTDFAIILADSFLK